MNHPPCPHCGRRGPQSCDHRPEATSDNSCRCGRCLRTACLFPIGSRVRVDMWRWGRGVMGVGTVAKVEGDELTVGGLPSPPTVHVHVSEVRAIAATCPCGLEHDTLDWSRLEACGDQSMPWGEVLELRNCSCGSTLAVTVARGDFDAWEHHDIERDPDGVVEELMKRSA